MRIYVVSKYNIELCSEFFAIVKIQPLWPLKSSSHLLTLRMLVDASAGYCVPGVFHRSLCPLVNSCALRTCLSATEDLARDLRKYDSLHLNDGGLYKHNVFV